MPRTPRRRPAPVPAVSDEQIAVLRRFARSYTEKTGLLARHLYGSKLSLTEARILYELAISTPLHAADIGRNLSLDRAHLSRVLKRFETAGWIARRIDAGDRRRATIRITARGRTLFAAVNRRANDDIRRLLAALPADIRHRLVEALDGASRIIARAVPAPVDIRAAVAGDFGFIVHRHAILYANEYGWNGEFEALVAEITAGFIRSVDAASEGCWVAERDGVILGSAMLVKVSPELAKLRLVYLEPEARGLGLGGRLVDHCIAFARAAGYRRITLWTNDILTAARRLYQRRGFVLVASEPHHSFGQKLVGENWELAL